MMVDTERYADACRYGNAMRNKTKRDYCFAYLSYLKGGAYGNPPDRGKLSVMAAQAVRLELDSRDLWERKPD